MTSIQDDTYQCDVLVAGSGCAGMAAAVTAGHHGLNVLVVEKEPKFGGTTARSGGWLWIPGTSLAREWGIVESPEQARTYLRHEAGNSFDAARVDAFLNAGPEAVDFFTSKTALRFDMPLTFPDYHAEAPGGTQGGRSMVTRPFDGRELGPLIRDIGLPLPELTVFGMMLGSGKEIIHFMRATKSLTSALYVTRRLSKHFMDVMRHGRGMTLDQWQCARRAAGQIGHGFEDSAVAVVAGARPDRRGRRGARRHNRARRKAHPRQRPSRRGARLWRLSARCGEAQGDVPARANRQRTFFAGPRRQHRRRFAAGGDRRRPRRG